MCFFVSADILLLDGEKENTWKQHADLLGKHRVWPGRWSSRRCPNVIALHLARVRQLFQYWFRSSGWFAEVCCWGETRCWIRYRTSRFFKIHLFPMWSATSQRRQLCRAKKTYLYIAWAPSSWNQEWCLSLNEKTGRKYRKYRRAVVKQRMKG